MAEILVDAASLLPSPAEQGDALAVFAHARQRVANSASAWFFSSESSTKMAPMTTIEVEVMAA